MTNTEIYTELRSMMREHFEPFSTKDLEEMLADLKGVTAEIRKLPEPIRSAASFSSACQLLSIAMEIHTRQESN